jgi:hypothetical protein
MVDVGFVGGVERCREKEMVVRAAMKMVVVFKTMIRLVPGVAGR